MPAGDLRAMLDAADILSATERLGAIVDGAVSAGNLKKGQSRDHMRRLEKTVESAADRAQKQSQGVNNLAELQSFGISVVQAPKSGAGGS